MALYLRLLDGGRSGPDRAERGAEQGGTRSSLYPVPIPPRGSSRRYMGPYHPDRAPKFRMSRIPPAKVPPTPTTINLHAHVQYATLNSMGKKQVYIPPRGPVAWLLRALIKLRILRP